MTKAARSQDGTRIAFEQVGHGPSVILIGGELEDRTATAPLAAQLTAHFTVLSYDRRGRGESGDAVPYAVAREIEDIDALLVAAGGSACLFGHSSGAVLALEAADQLPTKVERLALYEPPFIVDDSRSPFPGDYLTEITMLVAEHRPGDAVEYFLNHALDAAPEWVARTKEDSAWPEIVQLAHTLPYDGAVMADTRSGMPLPIARWASVAQPTLVLKGEQSATFLRHAAEAIAEILPNAQLRTVESEGRGPAAELVAPALVEFFGASS